MRTVLLSMLLVACGGVDTSKDPTTADTSSTSAVTPDPAPNAITEPKPDEVSVEFDVHEPPHPSNGSVHVIEEVAVQLVERGGGDLDLSVKGEDVTADDKLSATIKIPAEKVALGVHRFRIEPKDRDTLGTDIEAWITYKPLTAWYFASCLPTGGIDGDCYGTGELAIYELEERLAGEIDITFSHQAKLGRTLVDGQVVAEVGDVIARLIVTFDLVR